MASLDKNDLWDTMNLIEVVLHNSVMYLPWHDLSMAGVESYIHGYNKLIIITSQLIVAMVLYFLKIKSKYD